MGPILTALFVFVAPPLAGFLVGRLVGRLRAPRLVWPLALVALVALAANARTLPFSLYDVLLAALTFAIGLVVGGTATEVRRWPGWGLLVSAVLLTLGGAAVEAYARRLPEPAMQSHHPSEMHLVFRSGQQRDYRCENLFSPPVNGSASNSGPPRILYVGDSMLHPRDVPRGTTFFDLVQQERPGIAHVNMGTGGVGPDMYLSVIRRHLAAVHPDRLVVFLYLGNDIFDIDRPYSCCGDGPLLGSSAAGLPLNCPTPAYSTSYAELWRTAPAPYPLRVLGHWSKAARQLSAGFARTQQRRGWQLRDWIGNDAQFARLRAILFAIRDEAARQRVPLSLVLLPPRWSLEDHSVPDPFRATHESALRSAAEAGIATLDTWDLLQAAITREPQRDWFHAGSNGNPHLGVAGHRLVADLLLSRLLPPP